MEMFSFEPRTTWIFTILLFLGGCAGWEPGDAVVIQTPASETTSKEAQSSMEIRISGSNGLTIRYGNPAAKAQVYEAMLSEPSADEIEKEIQEVLNRKNTGQELETYLYMSPGQSPELFKKLIKSLANKNIYRYKLVSAPE